jgi:hypothetical protein
MASGLREDESRVSYCPLALPCLSPCMIYLLRPQHLYGSCGDNRTAKNPRDVLVQLVHLGSGTLQVA